MNLLIRNGIAGLMLGLGVASVAMADEATTHGGLNIKSSDGTFEASLGGRIHFDGALLMPDEGQDALGTSSSKNASGFYFRRVFISLAGKLYGWDYHIDDDISGSGAAGLNDLWFAHDVFGHDHLYIGQHKPWRSLDELASNNNIPLMERNILSANGIFGGRDFTQGLYYKHYDKGLWEGASFYTDGKTGSTTGRSFGLNGRLAYAPIVSATRWLHTGLTYSLDNISHDGDGDKAISPGYSTWYAKKGQGVTLVSFAGAKGNEVNASTSTAEVAGAFGPAFLQAEYGHTHQWEQTGHTATVDDYSVTLAYALTGETRPYSVADASYGGIKPKSANGAWEVAARYDSGRTSDYSQCALAAGATRCAVSSITAGVNYYVNPNVRFMLDYQHGQADAGQAGKDSPDAVMARAQLVF